MRIVVLGASGLIGHKLFQTFTDRFDQCYAVLHRDRSIFADCGLFDTDKVIDKLDAMDFDHLKGVLHAVNPDVILNCVGITKTKASGERSDPSDHDQLPFAASVGRLGQVQ